jgi:hypothetical protein
MPGRLAGCIAGDSCAAAARSARLHGSSRVSAARPWGLPRGGLLPGRAVSGAGRLVGCIAGSMFALTSAGTTPLGSVPFTLLKWSEQLFAIFG